MREIGGFALKVGVVIGVAGLAVLLLAKHLWGAESEQLQRTYLLTTLIPLGLNALRHALADSSKEGTLDRRLRWLAAAAVPVYLLTMYVPFAARASLN